MLSDKAARGARAELKVRCPDETQIDAVNDRPDAALHEKAAVTWDAADALGLGSEEARRRLEQFGPNTTPDAAVHPIRLILGKFIAPVPCLLEAAIVLQLFLGEYIEASVIAVLLIFNAALGFFHEGRAQATIEALKSRLALLASVRRDGKWNTIPAAELVPGDAVKLSLGSVVAADVRLLAGSVLLDQSMITGESMPLEAGPGLETYAGALVRRGEAVAAVTATGTRTKFGRTAELVRTAHVTSSQQKAISRPDTRPASALPSRAALRQGFQDEPDQFTGHMPHRRAAIRCGSC